MKKSLIFATLILTFSAASAYVIDFNCPSPEKLRSLSPSQFYLESSSHAYFGYGEEIVDNRAWNYVLGKIPAANENEAYQKARTALAGLSSLRGVQIGGGYVMKCRYPLGLTEASDAALVLFIRWPENK